MLDLKYVREHAGEVRQNLTDRGVSLDLERLLEHLDTRSRLLAQIQTLREERNANTAAMKGHVAPQQRSELVEVGKRLKRELGELEARLAEVQSETDELALRLPNRTHPDSPRGADESANVEIEVVGNRPTFDFAPADHLTLGTKLDIIDFDTAAKVAGSKFYYLRNQGVFLELALVRFALDVLQSHRFTPLITPDVARTGVTAAIGFNPRGAESNIYNLADEDLTLIGTAEITLGGYHADRTLDASELPLRLAGLSHCFRREAGAAGQFSRGLYRVHQFTKVEMFVVCLPQDSPALHRELLTIEKAIFTKLDIPFRVVDVCTGDLGGPAYRKFDLEAWMPGRGEGGEWGEITSTSNCTDYQSRRLGTRFKNGPNGERGYVHMLNGTAVAVSRAMIALLENHQQADGSVVIPRALRPYTGFARIDVPT